MLRAMSRLETGIGAPDFSLTDAEGEEFVLSSLEGRYSAVLVFNRGFV